MSEQVIFGLVLALPVAVVLIWAVVYDVKRRRRRDLLTYDEMKAPVQARRWTQSGSEQSSE